MKGGFKEGGRAGAGPPLAVTRYEKIAARAIDGYLRENRHVKSCSLYLLSEMADEAAFAAGKKRQLYPSLYDYERLLPKGARVFWSSSGLLSVANPYCRDGSPLDEAVHVPGPFDAAVDMGPGAWSAALKSGRAV